MHQERSIAVIACDLDGHPGLTVEVGSGGHDEDARRRLSGRKMSGSRAMNARTVPSWLYVEMNSNSVALTAPVRPSRVAINAAGITGHSPSNPTTLAQAGMSSMAISSRARHPRRSRFLRRPRADRSSPPVRLPSQRFRHPHCHNRPRRERQCRDGSHRRAHGRNARPRPFARNSTSRQPRPSSRLASWSTLMSCSGRARTSLALRQTSCSSSW
jgi:hypothetical protein